LTNILKKVNLININTNKGICQMNIDRFIFAFAGIVIMLSLALGYFISPYWLLLTAFVGFNMFQAAFTGFCPLAMILKKLGLKSGEAFK
tara:strand:- start:587 stop:853 length:267 start_codon:yes stop_codon:yes gene_type:complete